jgi:hypothetical protein
LRHLGQVSACHMTSITQTGSQALRKSKLSDAGAQGFLASSLEFFMIDLTIRESAGNVIVASLLTLVVIGSATAVALG